MLLKYPFQTNNFQGFELLIKWRRSKNILYWKGPTGITESNPQPHIAPPRPSVRAVSQHSLSSELCLLSGSCAITTSLWGRAFPHPSGPSGLHPGPSLLTAGYNSPAWFRHVDATNASHLILPSSPTSLSPDPQHSPSPAQPGCITTTSSQGLEAPQPNQHHRGAQLLP